jgi:outer membrane protein assembly factor BamD
MGVLVPRRTRTTRYRFLVVLAACLAAAAGCSPVPEFGESTAEDAYAVGVEAMEREDYLLAIEAFNHVTMASPLGDWADDALIGLADAHRAISDYAMAEDEYRRLLSDYPRSELVPEAVFKLGLTFYDQSLPAELDQTMTVKAIEQLERFTATYPETGFVPEAEERIAELRSRLAEKSHEAAALYLRLGDLAAARVYLLAIVEDYPDTPWAPRALLEIARSHAREGSTAQAAEAYDRLIERYPDTEEAAAARAERTRSAP